MVQGAEQITICTASSGFWWLTPAIIAISALTAAVLSILSIRTNREIARKKSSIDLIVQTQSTEYYQGLRRAFHDIRMDDAGFDQIYAPTNPEVLKQRQMVLNYLNHYELIAMGIFDGILDEQVYKNYMRSILVRDWFAAVAFIEHIRTPTPDSGADVPASAAFSQFERLALKWAPEVKRAK